MLPRRSRRFGPSAALLAAFGLIGCSLVGKDLDTYFSGSSGAGAGATGGVAGGSGGGAGGGAGGSGAGGSAGTTGGAGGSGGSAGSTGGSGGAGGSAGCNSKQPPVRPTIADTAPEAGAEPKIFILRDIVIDQAPTLWESIGYDLDGKCSYPPDYDVECVAQGAGSPEIDGDNGIDNVFGHTVIPLLKVADKDIQEAAQRNQAEGESAIVVHITGWNGEDDDPSVQVWLAETAYAIPEGSSSRGLPKWDGTDAFYVPDAAFLNGQLSSPVIANDNAYIVGRVLVMRLPDRSAFPFQTSSGPVFLKLTGATLTGTISADGLGLEDVIMAGRWASQDVLATLEFAGLCRGDVKYGLIENLLTNSADIRSTPGTGGPSAVCDAISIGIGLTGYPGKFGGLVPSVPTVNPCTAGSGGTGGSGGTAGGGTAGSGTGGTATGGTGGAATGGAATGGAGGS